MRICQECKAEFFTGSSLERHLIMSGHANQMEIEERIADMEGMTTHHIHSSSCFCAEVW